MSKLELISDNAIFQFRNSVVKAIVHYGYLAAVKLLKEYEDKEYYYTCFCIYSVIKSKGNDIPTTYGKEALNYVSEFFEAEGAPDKFDTHLQDLERRVNKMREFIEKSWAFMQY